MTDILIATQGDENWVLSKDGAYIYVAGNDGYLKVFDAHTGESVYSVDLGANLGAIALSPDGTRLSVVEEVPGNVQQSQNWTENSADVSFYIVDLSTFGAQKHTYHVTADGYTFADVTWTDNDTLQLSQNILPGWSGWAPLATVELATGALTEHSSYYSGLGTSASLLTIPNSNTVLLGQLGLSSAEYFLIGPDGNSLGSNGIYNNDVYGYAGGIEAASGTTASDRIIIVTGGGAHLYSGTMTYIKNLASNYPNLGSAAGVTFSADGQRIFFLDWANKSVVVIDAYNYALVATVQLPGVTFGTLKWGEEIVVAPDGKGVYYNTSSGISYVAVDLPSLGTEGTDQLSGTAGDDLIDGLAVADTIFGLAGNDWLIGGPGNDLLNGGDGLDIVGYETATAGVIVNLGLAGAQATVAADSDTLVSIEGVSGSPFDDTLTGNGLDNLLMGYDGHDTLLGLAGDDDLYGEIGNDHLSGGAGVDWLFGGSGADFLDGGTGADRLAGEDGNDTYVVDDAGDVVIETATGGHDTMQVSNINATIASSVEALVILSGSLNATGNFVANSLTGSDQANVLSGLGGNDILSGGAGDDTLIGGTGADTLNGGSGFDLFAGTAAEMNGDTITDMTLADRIVISDANLSGFAFSVSGNTLTYTGGSLTLTSVPVGLVASAALGGGVQIAIAGLAVDPASDINGDLRSDALWRSSDGTLTSWLGQPNGSFADNPGVAADAIGTDWHVAGIGDFNGDGLDDILWRHSTGEIGQWLGQASGPFVNNGGAAANPVGTDWAVVGIADYNGDGRDDILWQHSTGEIGQWVGMANGGYANNGGAAANAVDNSWTVLANGDFNGDGRGDILWRHSSGVFAEWQGTASGALVNAGGVMNGATGSVVGSGDFTGDGRDDVLMRGSNGQLTIWAGQASGQFSSSTPALQLNDMSWKVVAIGDYNGDRMDDLLWQHSSGAGAEWLGTGTGFAHNGAIPTMDAAWQIQAPDVWVI